MPEPGHAISIQLPYENAWKFRSKSHVPNKLTYHHYLRVDMVELDELEGISSNLSELDKSLPDMIPNMTGTIVQTCKHPWLCWVKIY